MVVVGNSEKEREFKEDICDRLWTELVDILEKEGIDVIFLADSKDMKFALETIENRLWFWKEKVKKNNEIITLYKEGKKFEKELNKKT